MQEGFSNFYKREGDRIVCTLCRHYCKLKEGQTGICGVNKNSGGRLQTLVYGKAAALNIDPIEKKPLYHFLPGTTALSIGTVGCNFKCPFCQNWRISQTTITDNSTHITPSQLVAATIHHNCQTIAYTYNEPTIFYPFARDTAKLARREKIKNIFVSNGFESKEVLYDMQGVIDAFNIDLKSFNPEYYKKHLKGSLDGVLDTLRLIKKLGFWLEVTTLIVPGVNDTQEEIHSIASFIAQELDPYTPWHISAFHPNYKMSDWSATSIKTLTHAAKIGKEHGLAYIYMGNVAIDAVTKCPACSENLITRKGYMVVSNKIKNGCCPTCGKEIEGVWS